MVMVSEAPSAAQRASPGTIVSLFLKGNGVLPVSTLCELSLILPVPTLSEVLKN